VQQGGAASVTSSAGGTTSTASRVVRQPNRKVRLFDGLTYTGTFIGTVDGQVRPLAR
jgi:hypothetical protein